MRIYKIASGRTLYHVTHTDRVPSIKKQGLIVNGESNWVSGVGTRYGGDAVYALENLTDAILWAAKQDWEFNTKMGSGNISIVEFQDDDMPWTEDTADPMSQLGAQGKWLKRVFPVKPDKITNSYPVTADMIRAASQKRMQS